MTTKLFINGRCGGKTEFRVISCFPAFQFGNEIGWVWFPANLSIVRQQRVPGEAVMRTHLGVIKGVLPIAPGAEDQRRIHICICNVVRPTRWHHYLFARAGLNGNAAARVIA